MMKRLTIALISAAAAAALGLPGAAQADNWTGFGASLDLGAAHDSLKVSNDTTVTQVSNVFVTGQGLIIVPGTIVSPADSGSATGFVFGGAAGWTGQAGSFVFGAEGDAHFGSKAGKFDDTESIPLTALGPASTVEFTGSAHTKYDWSLRAKAGYGGDNSIVYLAGGVASTNLELRSHTIYHLPAGAGAYIAAPALGDIDTRARDSGNLTGWTMAGGASWNVDDKTSLDIEARYDNFGSATLPMANVTTTSGALNNYGQDANNGQPLNPSPVATPGPTRVSLSAWRRMARLSHRF